MKVPYQFFTLWTCTQIRKKRVGVTQTLLAGMGRGGHAVPVFFDGLHYRRLSPRECFRLQGFPDSYAFPPTLAHNHLYKQAGNGVTVTLVERLARNIAAALEGIAKN
jgi:DNA (cytosine-5)-methyltransferase 1